MKKVDRWEIRLLSFAQVMGSHQMIKFRKCHPSKTFEQLDVRANLHFYLLLKKIRGA